MEVLRSVDQLYESLDKSLNLENEFDFEATNFAFELQKDDVLKPIAEKLNNVVLNPEQVANLFNLIFQLNDYTPILCNLCNLLMMARRYVEVFDLVGKVFVAHIGTVPYNSKNITKFGQRNFDRLVEIVGTAKISNQTFFEFLIEIIKPNQTLKYAIWKEPAIEYLKVFFTENEKWVLDYINQNQNFKLPTLYAILQINTPKGVDMLINEYSTNPKFDKKQMVAQMKDFKRDFIAYIDATLPKSSVEKQEKLVEILLEMSADNEVMTRLQELYSVTKDENVKNKISQYLGISDTMNVRTEKQFLYAAKRKIKEPQERTLNLPFSKFSLHTASGLEATNTVFTFIIYLFKEENNLNNLYKLKVLDNIFNAEELHNFADAVFEHLKQKDDILQAKWCVRMFALLAPSSSINKTFDFLSMLLKQERIKEAKYLITCLIFAKHVEIIDFIKFSLEENQLFIKDNLQYFVTTISNCLDMHEEDIRDMLVPNEFSVGEFDIQRDRLYNAFLAGKMYSLPIFKKLFLENKIYNKLAQNLVFGEYRNGRLYNAFVIEDVAIKFVVGQTIFDENNEELNEDIFVGIVHPLDCDFKFQPVFKYFQSPTFNQFKPAKFDCTESPVSATAVNRFVGMMINVPKFLNYVFANGFQSNKTPDDMNIKSIVHMFPLLNMFVEVEFEKAVTMESAYTSLSYICFYKISDTIQSEGKYITQKANALPIANLPKRYYDHVLSIIFEGSKL